MLSSNDKRMAHWKLNIVQTILFSLVVGYAYANWPLNLCHITDVAPSSDVFVTYIAVIHCLVKFYCTIIFYLLAIMLKTSISLIYWVSSSWLVYGV